MRDTVMNASAIPSIDGAHPKALADLVASRICHDLISPVGALGNGLELISVADGGDIADELELIRDCAEAARHSLTFMRLAFGAAGPGDLLSHNEVAKAATPYMAAKKLTLSWAGPEEAMLRTHAKARLLLLLLASDAMPRGGDATLTSGLDLSISAKGIDLRSDVVSENLARAADGRADRPGLVHYPVLWNIARDLELTPYVASQEERLDVGLR